MTVVIVTHDRQISRKVDRVVAIRDGRTSSEFIRRRSYAEELAAMGGSAFADQSDTHDELVVLDRAGMGSRYLPNSFRPLAQRQKQGQGGAGRKESGLFAGGIIVTGTVLSG